MAQYLRKDKVHPQAGRWGRSQWLWHYLQWEEDGDGGACDGASLCGRYLSPPYVGVPPTGEWQRCSKCAKRSSSH